MCFPNLPSREVKELSFRLPLREFTWKVYGSFQHKSRCCQTEKPRGTAPTPQTWLPSSWTPADPEARVPGRSRRQRSAGQEGGADLCDVRTTPLGEGAAPAPERPSRSRKWKVCQERAAGSRCPEAEALAKLARQPPTAMSAFDTNPFADPMDVNPFQVELPTHRSLECRRPPPGPFPSARRRGGGGTGRPPNGRAGSPGWPVVACVGRHQQQVEGWALVAWEEVGPSNCPDKAPLTGYRGGRDWSRLEVPRASE